MNLKFLFFILLSLSFSILKAQSKDILNIWQNALNRQFKDAKVYQLKDTIKEDFNGDNFKDKAIFTSENSKYGILIIHGNTGEKIKIGIGEEFDKMGDDFNWVDYWALIKDKKTHNIIVEDGEIEGEETVNLMNPNIALRKESVGDGLITFKDGRYQWIHQSD